jgi:CheY-like chemotaxis protein
VPALTASWADPAAWRGLECLPVPAQERRLMKSPVVRNAEPADGALAQSQETQAAQPCTGSIAHDFNNILASMVGWIHLARRKSDAPEVVALLDKALAAGERGQRLTLRLLASSRGEAPVPAALAGNGERVLVVDGDAESRGTIAALLRFNGYETDHVANGRDALDEVERELPDVVLLDPVLPDISGLDVARRLRAAHPALPLVFVGGYAGPEVPSDAVPGAGWLSKPLRSDELHAELRRHLDPLRRAQP